MIEQIVAAGLTNAVVASLLAMIALLIDRFRRCAPLAHFLWLVVLVKLVTPPIVDLPLTIPVAKQHVIADVADDGEIRLVAQTGSSSVEQTKWGEDTKSVSPTELNGLPSLVHNKSMSAVAALAWRWLLAVWSSGAIIVIVTALIRLYRFHRLVSRTAIASEELRNELVRVAQKAGVGSIPDVRITMARIVPLALVVGSKPVLVLPKSLLSSLDVDERASILAHELAHLHRRDHWRTWIELLVVGLYWWHPVAWLARRQLHRAADECCDGWVLRWFPDAAIPYAQSMMKTLDFLADGIQPKVGLASAFGQLNSLKGRFEMVLQNRTTYRLTPAARFLACTAGALVLVVSPLFVFADAPDDRAGATPAIDSGLQPSAEAGAAVDIASSPEDRTRASSNAREDQVKAFGQSVAKPGKAYRRFARGPSFLIERNEAGEVVQVSNFSGKLSQDQLLQLQNLNWSPNRSSGFTDDNDYFPRPALRDVIISDADMVHLRAFKNLRSIEISIHDDFNGAGIGHLKDLRRLVMLTIRGKTFTDEGMVYLKDFRQLESLELLGTGITDKGLIHLKPLTQLSHLALNNNDISSLEALKDLTSLEDLWLDNTDILDRELVFLKGMNKLKFLTLAKTPITDAAFKYLKGINSLTVIWLDHTNITNDGLIHLKEMPNLQALDLQGTRISDVGLRHLKDMRTLRQLSLRDTQITDAGLVHLHGLDNLVVLNLKGTQLSAAAVQRFWKNPPPKIWHP